MVRPVVVVVAAMSSTMVRMSVRGLPRQLIEMKLKRRCSGVLMRRFPPELVDAVIAEAGRREQGHRSLPAQTLAYFAIGMALHSEGSYEVVLGLLTDGLSWVSGAEPVVLPSKSANLPGPARLGAEPIAALFEAVAVPLAVASAPGGWLAGRRLVAIDGTSLDVTDTPENAEWFGRPGVSKGEQAAFPQARFVAVAECGTHAMFDAVVGAYTTGENTLARELIDRLEPGMLVLADRGFCGFPLWRRAVATGADLLWRAKSNMKPRYLETLADGSWLAELRASGNAGRHSATLGDRRSFRWGVLDSLCEVSRPTKRGHFYEDDRE